ncbi:hypothetical protein ACK3ZE_08650, partial [Aeromonas caviae]
MIFFTMDSLNADLVADYTTGGMTDGALQPKRASGETGIVAASAASAALPMRGNKKGSSRDLGEVEVDRQGAGKLAVSKHTT